MSSENRLVIYPDLDIDQTQVEDKPITEINQAFAKLYQERRAEVVGLLRQLPSIIEIADKFVTGRKYQAVISPEALKRLKVGTARWDQHKDGLLGAIIRDNDSGQIICHVKLREISPELLTSINQIAVQRTLAEIVQKLEIIDQKITSVLKGQHNDRLGIVEGGIDLYRQAMMATESENRRQLLISAIGALNVGRQNLIQSLEADVEFIDNVPHQFWQMILHSVFGSVSKQVQDKASLIQEAFQAALRASYVVALAYEALGEPKSLQASLESLRRMLLKVGTRGEKIARWLPYDASAPPEELWRNSMQLADEIEYRVGELEQGASKDIAVTFSARDMVGGAHGRSNL